MEVEDQSVMQLLVPVRDSEAAVELPQAAVLLAKPVLKVDPLDFQNWVYLEAMPEQGATEVSVSAVLTSSLVLEVKDKDMEVAV